MESRSLKTKSAF